MTALLQGATAAATLALLAALSTATAAHAEERQVTITSDGVAPPVVEVEPGDALTPAAGAAPGASPTPATPAVQGDLAGAPTERELGLPTALGAVLVVGVASLLLRVLLAEPVLSEGRGTL